MKNVSDLKAGVSGILSGANLTKVTNLEIALERAARTLSQKITVPEAGGRQSYLFYNDVFDYPAPLSIFGGAITDLRPQGIDRTVFDETYRQQVMQFDQTKCTLPNGVGVTFEWRNGVPIMRVSKSRAPMSVIIDPMNSVTGWAAGGHGTNLALDSQVYYTSPAALRFNASAVGASYIEKTLSNSIDLSSYSGVGMVFLALYTPDTTDLASLSIRLGSSSVNYVEMSATQGFVGAWWTNNYLLVALDLSNVTTTGTPNFSKIAYVRATATVTAAISNLRFGYLFASLGSPYELLFKTAAIFLHNGVPSSTIQSDSDQIILNDAAYNIYEHESAMAVAMQKGATISAGLMGSIAALLNGARTRTGVVVTLGLYDLYRAANPSETIETVGNWYD